MRGFISFFALAGKYSSNVLVGGRGFCDKVERMSSTIRGGAKMFFVAKRDEELSYRRGRAVEDILLKCTRPVEVVLEVLTSVFPRADL